MSNTTQTFRGSPSLSNGTKVHAFGTTTTTIATAVTVASHTVTAGTTLQVTRIDASCSSSGLFEVFDGATRIGVMRVGAGNKNAFIEYYPTKDISAGTTITVKFTAATRTGIDVEALIQGAEL